MNTITQIENALKAINQAAFQNLINHLLYLKGYNFMGAPGAVVGKEKTKKGAPDSFFVDNGDYIFVECTTMERIGESKSFIEKLSKDIDHCFDEKVTNIKKEAIKEVILGINEKVTTKEYNNLLEKVKSYNYNTAMEILNIQNLPLIIYEFPRLANEYLNIEAIKGDIFHLNDFLKKTEKGLQPSLINEFIGRDEELKKATQILDEYDILLLTGGAGVGKSKLAVEIMESLSSDGYIPIVIQSSGVSLWDDYKHLFSHQKKHIILFDDANKSINNLNYLLSKLEAPHQYLAKLIITSRDYVKRNVLEALKNYRYDEINISEVKDEQIEKITTAAVPNLRYHSEINRKIIGLSKGNARMALMAAYSVTPNSDTNYLNSPVLLYEKYFTKISDDIGIFNKPIILKTLAVVSFFGVIDRNNEELKTVLFQNFSMDWDELWTAIMELHNNELLDVYSGEIVKVSDQVLSTYAFYKCFIDDKYALLNYGEWISAFVEKYSSRVQNTLIDVNNTFHYQTIKPLVEPHLNEIQKKINSDEFMYKFFELFWFYKGRRCLLFIKKWIESLPLEQNKGNMKFTYVHNDHLAASKYVDLLIKFWTHPNELLKPSLKLTLKLLELQPSRLPEILKFLVENFKYTIEDIENEYVRQNTLLDVIIDESLLENQKIIGDGIFLLIAEDMLGWRFSEFKFSSKNAYTIYNFNLVKSDGLMKLRRRILTYFLTLLNPENDRCQKILDKIIYPGGDIDNSIYMDEIPIYNNIIQKLDKRLYVHCEFVNELSNILKGYGKTYPEFWKDYIESDIRRLSDFIMPDRVLNNDESIEDSEIRKQQELSDFVTNNEWIDLEKFLVNVSNLHSQQNANNVWHIEMSVTEFYILIAKKDKAEFIKALELFFSGGVSFPLQAKVLYTVLFENILTGLEIWELINRYEFEKKLYWESTVLAFLPDTQVNNFFLEKLIASFKDPIGVIYTHRILNYLKYGDIFDGYKESNEQIKDHNIVTYLSFLILNRPEKTRHPFGFHFFAECSQYFTNHLNLLKEIYWTQHKINHYFDSDGKELKAILNLDRRFINDSLKKGTIGIEYNAEIRLERLNTSILWQYDDCEKIIEELIIIIIEKTTFISVVEKDIHSIFRFRNIDDSTITKVKSFIIKLTSKYKNNDKLIILLVEVVYKNFNNWFFDYFREFLLSNKNIDITKKLVFGRSESYSGSRVPVIQGKIEFFEKIIEVIYSLPDLLEYSSHIDYFEEKIEFKRKEIIVEQKRDFMDEFY